MESPAAKTSRLALELAGGGGDDRISQLPDPVLHHVLSKLLDCEADGRLQETRHVARTMVLSKRWKTLHASAPHLSFRDLQQQSTASVVNAALLLRDPSADIHTFRLVWHHNVGRLRDHHLATWAQHAAARNVRVLDLDVEVGEHVVDEPMEFPACVFACGTLEELRLAVPCIGASLSSLPPSVRLGRLRRLRLHHFHAGRGELERLLAGCPVLGELELEECSLEDPDVSSETLAELSVETAGVTGSLVRISCPNLRSVTFQINDVAKMEVLLENVSSLVDATLQIEDYCYEESLSYPVVVEPLKFVTSTNHNPGLPIFRNLKSLTLYGIHMELNFAIVTNFLESSPELELLILQKEDAPSEVTETLFYNCEHYNLEVILECDEENGNLVELMDRFFDSKCDCS